MGEMEEPCRNISPRGSIPAACFQMAMESRMGAGVRAPRTPYGARDAKAKK